MAALSFFNARADSDRSSSASSGFSIVIKYLVKNKLFSDVAFSLLLHDLAKPPKLTQ